MFCLITALLNTESLSCEPQPTGKMSWLLLDCVLVSYAKSWERRRKKPLSRLGCQQTQRQKPALTSGQKLGSDYLKLCEIDTTGLESLSCTSQVNHNKSLKRKGQTCEVLFVFTETSSPTYPQPNQQRNQLPLVRLKPDPRNERRTWPPGGKETTNEPLSPVAKG